MADYTYKRVRSPEKNADTFTLRATHKGGKWGRLSGAQMLWWPMETNNNQILY